MSFPDLNWDQARDYLRALGAHANEWAGIPCPIEGEQLVIHRSYPFADAYRKPPEENDGAILVNEWYDKRGWYVVTWRESDRKLCHARVPSKRIDKEVRTLGVSMAWDIDAEVKALGKLRGLVPDRHFNQYLLTGTFLETSKRTGITYLFRKLRPTVALRKAPDDGVRILCALCMHPIGYYAETWGGAMVPTDDVIAHLLLMRGDEPGYWRQANQHAPWWPEAGI